MKMAALPSPTQVAGSHNSIYESYYQLVDPNNQGSVGALDAAKFLKKSGLSDGVLSKVKNMLNTFTSGRIPAAVDSMVQRNLHVEEL